MPALELFHPAVRAWFQRRFDAPTEAQERGWPEIVAGRDTLITTPTGSGKVRSQWSSWGIVKPQLGHDGAPAGGSGCSHFGQAVERRVPQWAQNCQFGATSCWHD